MQPAALVAGRFCPVTRGHDELIKKLYDYDKKGIKSFIFVINGEKSSKDLAYNPLSYNKRVDILYNFFPDITIDVVSSAYEIIDVLNVQGYQPKFWICGSDRVENYKKLLKHAESSCELISIDRESGITKDISGTMAREAARQGNSELFTRLLPIHKDAEFINSIMKDIQKVYKCQTHQSM